MTFLFTDIEGSTRLWDRAPQAMQAALARHDRIVLGAIGAHSGFVFSRGGDGFGAAFARAGDAIAAAHDAQARLYGEPWPDDAHIRVRIGLHTGEVEERDGDYFGTEVNRAARLMRTAHGGQVVLSHVTGELARRTLPPGVRLADLGEHRLAGLDAPVHVFDLVLPQQPARFPPLRSMPTFTGALERPEPFL
ncbi:MAG TPA: adenylate/guanylate cyclase domain-containing protein, partial [Acidimicrobiales bacterium]|nr:adenylate/guanylate cyclase domain-containing protein [Acidimicrobiales bacterium]